MTEHKMKSLKKITLEVSLKPFKKTDTEYIESVCKKVFSDWMPLLRHCDEVGIMLWCADGSEILEYDGNPDREFEWCRFIGGANPRGNWDKEADPDRVGLHTVNYDYIDEPPKFTYKKLKEIVSAFHRIGTELTSKRIVVCETFDPGPEFAVSDFKYNRHNEICDGVSLGVKSFVCCYGVLNGDGVAYAAYPDGIPDKTPFGTFFGKQCQAFLSDMGFDAIWLSNGFGFGTETWNNTGVTFDGENFFPEKIADAENSIIKFWELFRKECDYPIETRGTNLSLGIDYATDAVNHKKIYENIDLLPPPNSPWAAIDGNFGLELVGYMSKIAKLPVCDDFLFRFYVHDPWWLNSPWLDRYEGQPHDIYLPLSVSRIDENGKIRTPSYLSFLTVDDTLGNMPENCPNEIIPHIIKGFSDTPDGYSPFVWVYPFDDYSSPEQINKPFFEDWFIIDAVNRGLPLSSIISDDNFTALYTENKDFLKHSILVTPVPSAKNTEFSDSLIDFAKNGGKVLLYGALHSADKSLQKALGLKEVSPISGTFELVSMLDGDTTENGEYVSSLFYGGNLTDGGLSTECDGAKELAYAANGSQKRTLLCVNGYGDGKFIWCRGNNCARVEKPDDYPLASIMRRALADFGYDIKYRLISQKSLLPVVMLYRNRGRLMLSAYTPDTTAEINLKTEYGAPLLCGFETYLKDGYAVYHFPRSVHTFAIAFISGENTSTVGFKEVIATAYGCDRRFCIHGLKNATVRIITEGESENAEFLLNSKYPHTHGDPFCVRTVETPLGKMAEIENISGTLLISYPGKTVG